MQERIVFVTPQNITKVIERVKGADIVGLDTETCALHPKDGKLRLIQIGIPGICFILDCFKYDPRILLPLFDGNTRFVGHNLAFEFLWLASVGIRLPHGRNVFDTQIAEQVLFAGVLPTPPGLDDLALKYLKREMDKSYQKADWSGYLTQGHYEYAALDALIVLPLYDILMQQLEQKHALRTMRLEMRALPGMAWLQESGIKINVPGWQKLADENIRRVEQLERSLASYTDSEDFFGYSLINWNSDKQVLNHFNAKFEKEGRTTKKTILVPCNNARCLLYERECAYHSYEETVSVPFTIDNVSAETLAQLSVDGDELAQLVLKHRTTAKAVSTYGHSFLEQYVHTDWRMYPSYFQIGAATGRMSSSKPNGQNIPRSKEWRCLFIPEDGFIFAMADYSQIELRICIEMSRDPMGLKAYCEDNSDLHKLTAAMILGVDLTDKSEANLRRIADARQVAKSLNFGLIFGAGANTLRLYAQKAFGVIMTERDAIKRRNAWRQLYAGIVAWQKEWGNRGSETRTLGGRPRYEVHKFTEKLNTPVQGTGIDGLKAGVALCYERRGQITAKARPVAFVHDEILFECPEKDGDDVKFWIQKNMEEGMQSFLKTLPVVAEPKTAHSWGEK